MRTPDSGRSAGSWRSSSRSARRTRVAGTRAWREPERGAQQDDVLECEAEQAAVAPRPAPARAHHRPHARRRDGQHARDVGGAERRGAHGRSRRAHARACAGGLLTCSCARVRVPVAAAPLARAGRRARPRSRPPSPARRSSPPGSALSASIRSMICPLAARAGPTTISSPATFCSISASACSRYSSLYFVGSNSFDASCSISWTASSQLARLDRHLVAALDLAEVAHLVGIEERVHHQAALRLAQQHELLAAARREARHGAAAGGVHRLAQQAVGLLAALVGAEQVGLLEVDRVDAARSGRTPRSRSTGRSAGRGPCSSSALSTTYWSLAYS